jgi:cation diffusion facilitator family transporter
MGAARQGLCVMTKAQEHSHLSKVAIISIAVAVLVMSIKYLAYRTTGSVALYSDALESIVNLLTAVAALVAVEVSRRPADRRHQFGHHKAEYFSAVLEGVLITVAALLIFRESYETILHPRELQQPVIGLLINSSAACINGAWAGFLVFWGRRWHSPALVAEGMHLLTDVATSIGVIIGLALATATGWTLLDPALAGLVACNILWAGWRVIAKSFSGLMDEAVTGEVSRHIRQVIASNAEGALEVHDLKTRIAGRATFIEFHLVYQARCRSRSRTRSATASRQRCARPLVALKSSSISNLKARPSIVVSWCYSNSAKSRFPAG